MLENLKKILLSLSVIVLFALYALQKQTQPPGGSSTVSGYVTTVTPTPSATSPDVAALGSSSGGNAGGVPANGAYRDGTYTGSLADANWGNVEVQAVVANGQIRDVQFMQYPDHRSRSRSINQRAMPILTREAIQSQRAEVDVVTGATDTSYAFIQSLASALRQAAA